MEFKTYYHLIMNKQNTGKNHNPYRVLMWESIKQAAISICYLLVILGMTYFVLIQKPIDDKIHQQETEQKRQHDMD